MSEAFTLFFIGGPTASGKSALAESLSAKFRIPLISADSRQFFREMQIGTARAIPEQLPEVMYYMCGHLSVNDPFNVADFAREVYQLVESFRNQYPAAIVCGGSGLYLKAVSDGIDALPEANVALRSKLNQLYETEGIASLQAKLDPNVLIGMNESDRSNPRRLIRKIEIQEAGARLPAAKLLTPPSNVNIYKYFVDLPREQLYQRIDARVLQMVSEGLEAEARKLYPLKHLNSLQTVGYREMFDYFEGLYSPVQMVQAIQQHTRNYAKRQITWFSRAEGYQAASTDTISKAITDCLLKMR